MTLMSKGISCLLQMINILITSTTFFLKLKIAINAKGGDCWRFCRQGETGGGFAVIWKIDHCVIWLSLMEIFNLWIHFVLESPTIHHL